MHNGIAKILTFQTKVAFPYIYGVQRSMQVYRFKKKLFKG